MTKKILALLCVLAMLMGMFVVPATAAQTEPAQNRFLVGYAKDDVNPWIYSETLGMGVPMPEKIDDTDLSSWLADVQVQDGAGGAVRTEQIIRVPMSGYASSDERFADSIQNDNGDDYLGTGDGLFFTCTTVTDAEGYTVFLFTTDTISGYGDLYDSLASGIAEKMAARGVIVNEDQITVTGSHTHAAPDLGSMHNKATTEENNAVAKAKTEAEAAGQPFDENAFRAEYKPSAKNALWEAYYNYVVDKMVTAAVNAYDNKQEAIMTKGVIDASVSSGYQLNQVRHYLATPTTMNTPFVTGAHLNQFVSYDKNAGKYITENFVDADDTMYLLQFAFEDESQDPIVLVNWRAHATMMGGGTSGLGISADYISAFRQTMEQKGYRAAFFQGAAGNIVAGSEWHSLNNTGKENAIFYGGTLLADVALDCLDGNMTEELPAGKIRNIRVNMELEMQQDSPGILAAAKKYKETYTDAGKSCNSHPYAYKWLKSEGGDGKTYLINSASHARAVVSRSTANAETYADVKLNAYKLGEYVAVVTAPNELLDRYSLTATMKTINEDNDWYDLKDDVYGMPFVFAYTNGHGGYMGNNLSYTYNSNFKATYPLSNLSVGIGSYEANSSRAAQGEGEKVIVQYKKMLDLLTAQERVAVCEHCKEEVTWRPLIAYSAGVDELENGHYYMTADFTQETVTSKSVRGKVCLDLNGHSITGDKRIFSTATGSEFSLMDSVGGGKVTAYTGSNNTAGGLMSVNAGSVFNLYGGTLQFIKKEVSTANRGLGKGGVAALNGTMNMYGGTIIGGETMKSPYFADTDIHNGCGGSIFMYASGVLNVYGGTIQAGSAVSGRGDCVYAMSSSSKVTLSGEAHVDEVYFQANGNKLTVSGNYTGRTAVKFNPDNVTLGLSQDVGSAVNTSAIKAGTLTCSNEGGYQFTACDGELMLLANSAKATIGTTAYESLEQAIADHNDSTGYVKLLQDAASVAVDKNVYMDLNGHNIGSVTGSGKLLCLDTQTDDYAIEGNAENGYSGYGVISNYAEDSVAAVTVDDLQTMHGYAMIKETEKGASFHCVNLQLTHMSLKPKVEEETEYNPSLYYKSAFAGDALVAANVKTFGVALSTVEEPNATNMGDTNKFSWFDGSKFKAGENNNDATSTLLYGVMKETNAKLTNKANAVKPVYGRAYVQLQNGQYIFGYSACRTLKQQIEEADSYWESYSDSQKAAVINMYKAYSNILSEWNIPNIKKAAK